MRLNEKTLDPVSGALFYRLDTSIHYLPDDHLKQFNKGSLFCALQWWGNIQTEYIKI